MLQVSNLSKRYGDELLFQRVSFVVNRGERVGLVGPNGCGKTTLLRILIGEEAADTGSVSSLSGDARMGNLPQALTLPPDATVGDVLRGSRDYDTDYWAGRLQALATTLSEAQGQELPALETEYATILERLNWAAAHLPPHITEQVLQGLGLNEVRLDTPVATLSGGQKTRLTLAKILISHPALLLLDEPTNHLDITALEWLESYVREYDGAILMVSHDRSFLDHTVTRILEIDAETHTLKEYVGNYSDYAESKDREAEKVWRTFKEQQDRIAQLQGAVRQLKGQAGKIEHETIHFHYRKIAKKVARQGIVRQRRIERLLESEDHLDKPKQGWDMKLEFVDTPPSGQDVLVLEGVGKSFGDHLLFRDVNLLLRRGERIVLTGPNGAGKTTLLRIVVGEEPATWGRVKIGANVKIGYLSQEQDNLDWGLTLLDTVRVSAAFSETEARNFLHYFLFAGDDVFKRVEQISSGERARLSLAVLVLQGCNLLLLDEPINHLDIASREAFELALSTFEGTIITVVHDHYFLARVATAIWQLENRNCTRYIDMRSARSRAWGTKRVAQAS